MLNAMKVTLVGAGSTVFARTLISDLVSFPDLAAGLTVALMDIDAERLAATERMTASAGVKVEATLDRRRALDGADYVMTMFQVGGYRPATVIDFEVPKRFGLRQTIGDTLGIGGIMRGLRTIPVLLDVCREMEELCPDALLLQYVNPMAILCWAVARASSVRCIGLCHSVQGTAGELAADLGVPRQELEYVCVDPWTVGNFGHDVEANRRVLNCFLWMRMFPLDDPMNGVGGALVDSGGFHKVSATDGPLIYLNGNPDVQTILDRVEAAGGKILVPKTKISEEYGDMAVMQDTEGNRIGLHNIPEKI